MSTVFIYSHAFFVHFSVSLFTISVVVFLISFFSKTYIVKSQSRLVARWGLWLSAIAMLFTTISGFIAFNLTGHDDLSHLILVKHWMLSSAVLLMSIILGCWSYLLFKNEKEEGFLYLLAHFFAASILLYATFVGTELVYQNGIGVSSVPDVESHDHSNERSIKEDFNSIVDELFRE